MLAVPAEVADLGNTAGAVWILVIGQAVAIVVFAIVAFVFTTGIAEGLTIWIVAVSLAVSIVVFAAAAGVIFNEGVDAIWETSNRGKLYHHINWDQFAEEEEEDDDDDDDDDW